MPQLGRIDKAQQRGVGLESIPVRVASLSGAYSPRAARVLVGERAFWGCDSAPVLSRWAESKDVADLCVNVATSNTTMARVLGLIVDKALDWRLWMVHRVIEEQAASALAQLTLTAIQGETQQRESLWNSPKRALLSAALGQNETAFNW